MVEYYSLSWKDCMMVLYHFFKKQAPSKLLKFWVPTALTPVLSCLIQVRICGSQFSSWHKAKRNIRQVYSPKPTNHYYVYLFTWNEGCYPSCTVVQLNVDLCMCVCTSGMRVPRKCIKFNLQKKLSGILNSCANLHHWKFSAIWCHNSGIYWS